MRKKTAILFFMSMATTLSCSSADSDPKIQAQVGTVHGHSHQLSIRFADLERGQDRFVLESSAEHSHELRVDPEQRALLLLQFPVALESTEINGHVHPISLYVADD